VRGTIFDIDLTKEYIYVLDHQISLSDNTGEDILIQADKPFSLNTFSFLNLETFIKTIKNQAWEDLNQKYDTVYLNQLKTEIEAALKN